MVCNCEGFFPSLGRVECFPCFHLLGLVTLSLRSRFGPSGPCFVDCAWLCLLWFLFFPKFTTVLVLGRIVDWVCGRFLLLPFWGFGFFFVCFASHLSPSGWSWRLAGCGVSPLGLQVCSLRSVCGSLTPGRGVRLVARGPLLCPVTPRESAVRVLVLRCVLTGLFAVLGYFCVFRDI